MFRLSSGPHTFGFGAVRTFQEYFKQCLPIDYMGNCFKKLRKYSWQPRVAILRDAGCGVLTAGHFLFPLPGFDIDTSLIFSFIVLTYHRW